MIGDMMQNEFKHEEHIVSSIEIPTDVTILKEEEEGASIPEEDTAAGVGNPVPIKMIAGGNEGRTAREEQAMTQILEARACLNAEELIPLSEEDADKLSDTEAVERMHAIGSHTRLLVEKARDFVLRFAHEIRSMRKRCSQRGRRKTRPDLPDWQEVCSMYFPYSQSHMRKLLMEPEEKPGHDGSGDVESHELKTPHGGPVETTAGPKATGLKVNIVDIEDNSTKPPGQDEATSSIDVDDESPHNEGEDGAVESDAELQHASPNSVPDLLPGSLDALTQRINQTADMKEISDALKSFFEGLAQSLLKGHPCFSSPTITVQISLARSSSDLESLDLEEDRANSVEGLIDDPPTQSDDGTSTTPNPRRAIQSLTVYGKTVKSGWKCKHHGISWKISQVWDDDTVSLERTDGNGKVKAETATISELRYIVADEC